MSAESFLDRQFSLQINSSLEALPEVVEWFERLNLPDVNLLRLEAQTAMVEGFTNVVQHAHKHLPISTPVQILVQICGPMLQIIIWDHGQPYNFANAMEQLRFATTSDLDPLTREKHWGLVLFLKLEQDCGWRFSYDRLPDQRNCLLMEKPLNTSIT